MNETDKLGLTASLYEEHCELNHGPKTGHLIIPAVDYIVQPFGYTINEVEEVSVRDMVIPVCAECASALHGDEWTLLYCFECNSSQWIARSKSKMKYCHHVLWLRGCRCCTKEFGGLYFSDIKALIDSPVFLSQQKIVA